MDDAASKGGPLQPESRSQGPVGAVDTDEMLILFRWDAIRVAWDSIRVLSPSFRYWNAGVWWGE